MKVNKTAVLVACSVLYLVLSIFLYVSVPSFSHRFDIDSHAYTRKVATYFEHGQLVEPGTTACQDWVGIGYPLFMIAATSLGGSNVAVIWLQILLGLMIMLLTYKLAFWFFSERVSLLAAFLAATNIALVMYPQFLLTETLLCFLLLLAFERFIAFCIVGRGRDFIVSGFIFGLSVVVKPAALYYVGCLVVLMVLLRIRWLHSFFKCFVPRKWLLVCFAVSFVFPINMYVMRNKKLYGHYYLKAVDKINLYTYFLPKVLAQTEGISLDQARRDVGSVLEVTEFASGKGWDHAHAMLVEQVTQHPFVAIKIWLFNCAKTLGGLYTNHLKALFTLERNLEGSSYFAHQGSWWHKLKAYVQAGTTSDALVALGWFEVVWQLVRYMLVAIAIMALLVRRRWLALLMLGSFIAYFVLITGPDGTARLRFLVEMLLIMLTAYGVQVSFQRYRTFLSSALGS